MNSNTSLIADISISQAVKITGFGLLAMFLCGIFADSVAFTNIIIWDDAAGTVNNMKDNEMLFRTGIAGYIGDLIANVVVAIGLYVIIRPVSKGLHSSARPSRMLIGSSQ